MELVSPSSRAEWRQWLEKNHTLSTGVELVYHKRSSGLPTVAYQDAVEEALCFGWIDSTKHSLDEYRYKQVFTPRNDKSTWSNLNKKLVRMLEEQGLMHPSGQLKIQRAKENGCWDWLTDCEAHILPPDLIQALGPALRKLFEDLPSSHKKNLLWHIKEAKRPETRTKRIENIRRLF